MAPMKEITLTARKQSNIFYKRYGQVFQNAMEKWEMPFSKPLTVEDTNGAIEAMREERHRQIIGPWPK
jgi:hypothetical protein